MASIPIHDPAAAPLPGATTQTRNTTCYMCACRCGIRVHVRDGQVRYIEVTMGLFVGAMVPFVFAALTMQSVGRAAQKMIVEVRRQFAEIPGLREGRAGVKPDYARCVDISTAAALKEMYAS